ncbi:purine-cytosine permease family protein [Gordonia aichiensis]|uniref:purine-cytosine permease family protein n=1 Tax=Gordonia aichiensis TaxID=36820 RepID=UPI003265DC20
MSIQNDAATPPPAQLNSPETEPFSPPAFDANDFARTRVPDAAKRGAGSVLTVLVGFVTAFFFPLVGGLFLIQYGAAATWIGLVASFLVLIGFALVVTRIASREGLTSELLTRGAGFGTVGSVLTTVIYAGTFVIYAGTEGQILASSIDLIWDLPNLVWYVLVAVIFLPMAWNGIRSMTKILAYTLPIYFILLIVAIVIAWRRSGGMPAGMFDAMPAGATGGLVGVLGVMAALAGTIGINPFEASDYNRFIRAEDFKKKAFVSVVVPYLLLFFIAMPMGMYFTLSTGNYDPAIYFVGLLGLFPGVALAWISQIRVNLTNLHVSSVAFTSASETTGARPLTRRFWLVVVTLISIGLMASDVIGNLTTFLEWTGIFLLSWLACVVADIVVVRGALKIVTGPVEYRGEHLPRFNIVGVSALLVATVSGSLIWLLAESPILTSLAAFISFGIAFVVHVAVAVLTKGRTYFADPTDPRIAANNVAVRDKIG